MARYVGRKATLYLSSSGSTAAVNVANLTKWSLSFSRDKIDVTACNDANKATMTGLPDIKGSFEAWFDDTATATLFTGAASADGVKAYMYPSADAPTKFFGGPAYIDITNFEAAVSGAVKVSGTISANGAWAMIS